jgi:MFS family permease
MNEWFPSSYAWIPGTVCGLLAGLWGSMIKILAPQKKGKALVFASYWVLMFAGLASLLAGLIALTVGQQLHVWLGLLIVGVVLPVVMLPQYLIIRLVYGHFKQRDH